MTTKQEIILKIGTLTKLATDIKNTVATNKEDSDLLVSKKNLIAISNEIEDVINIFINLFDEEDIKI